MGQRWYWITINTCTDRIDAIIIDFWKAFDFVPHDRLLMKIAISGVDSRVVALMREFL